MSPGRDEQVQRFRALCILGTEESQVAGAEGSGDRKVCEVAGGVSRGQDKYRLVPLRKGLDSLLPQWGAWKGFGQESAITGVQFTRIPPWRMEPGGSGTGEAEGRSERRLPRRTWGEMMGGLGGEVAAEMEK